MTTLGCTLSLSMSPDHADIAEDVHIFHVWINKQACRRRLIKAGYSIEVTWGLAM